VVKERTQTVRGRWSTPVAGRVYTARSGGAAPRAARGRLALAVGLEPSARASDCLVDEERRRIALELHDTTGQNLSAAVLDLERALPSIGPSETGARPLVLEALALCLRSLEEIRTLSYALCPLSPGSAGLPEAIRRWLEPFARRSGVKVRLQAEPSLGRLPAAVECALFRVVQEALLNVKRHSGSGRATVALRRSRGGEVRLEIADRGSGISGFGRTFRPGLGLQSMSDRMAECGGRLEIVSGRGGTIVRAVVPGGGTEDAADPAR